jgi:beta-glucosidase
MPRDCSWVIDTLTRKEPRNLLSVSLWPSFDDGILILFIAFGHGLSYTSFDYSSPQVKGSVEDGIEVEVEVTNTGSTAGREVVQLYLSASFLTARPIQSLEAFAKTSQLEPGQSERVTLLLNKRSFSTWSEEENCWNVAAGEYELRVARNSRKIVQRASVKVDAALTWTGI